jgi:hypothetical protein
LRRWIVSGAVVLSLVGAGGYARGHTVSGGPDAGKAPETSASGSGEDCDPNYEGACLDPAASDYDCDGGSGDGPEYTGAVTVVGDDHFGLDRDGDGVGCQS